MEVTGEAGQRQDHGHELSDAEAPEGERTQELRILGTHNLTQRLRDIGHLVAAP